ncbi:LOW QUALITY PROTEIN: hypothetical protein Cgig2_021804 [Carnegiea gigantea]|uniref:Uncharacterized protein n=1 Tax=Carnegiea gigantea TaxID=171969 RepID=A0A9Q1KAJ8_9CARY|nr:LOW QUALITY PROTEIN: hypothetical protein Cgig2_021804 [Carnegiea gigantea]
MKVSHEVGVILKLLGECQHDLAQIVQHMHTTLLIALLPGLGRSLSPHSSLYFSFGKREFGRRVGLDEVRGPLRRANAGITHGRRGNPPGPRSVGVFTVARGAVLGEPASQMTRRSSVVFLPPSRARLQLLLAHGWCLRSQRPSVSPSLTLREIKGKSGQNQKEGYLLQGRSIPLEKFFRIKRPTVTKKKVLVARLTSPLLRARHGLYHLCHKLWNWPRLIVLYDVELEVIGCFPLLGHRFSEGVPDQLTLILNVSPIGLPVNKEEVIFPILHLWLLLYSRYVARPVVEVIPPGFLRSPLDGMNKAERSLCTVKGESETVVKSRMINCYTLGGRFVHDRIRLKKYEGIPRRRYCLSRAVLFNVRTTLGSGKWLLGPSCGSERVGALENSRPSATISGMGPTGERLFLFRTDLPYDEDTSCDMELVNAPPEDECLDAPSEDEEDVPPEGELMLLSLAYLEISHIISNGDLPWVRDLRLRAKNVRGG